jgi:(1->4)-alpha-D-glucan 1-alpha-D-glucosylmutase
VREAIESVVEEIQRGGDTKSFDALDELISAQPYRLSSWRVAAEEINYRRFFDINQLAAIRMELPEVFEATHRLVFELIKSGAVTGLRIDHVDGLFHPRAYLEQLQQRTAELLGSDAQKRPLYLLVEKILGDREHLRSDWPIHGTTGYEFANQVTGVLIDPAAESAFSSLYTKVIGLPVSFPELVYRGKRLVMSVSMASEVNVLGHMLNKLSETNRWYRDFTLNALTTAVREVIASFPVYRTYLVPGEAPGDDDVRIINRAIAGARRRNPALERTMFEFLREVLIPSPDNPHPVDEEARRAFVMKFQQCTGPITAKGVEDTAFYVFNRLIALNEVGGEPVHFGSTVEKFHDKTRRERRISRTRCSPRPLMIRNAARTFAPASPRFPNCRRSGQPPFAVGRTSTARRGARSVGNGAGSQRGIPALPDADRKLAAAADVRRGIRHYIGRIQQYMMKALHEAKVNSSWIEPNAPGMRR